MFSLGHILILVSFLLLASCGAKKSATKLKVSGAHALSNGDYEGGLVFLGTSTSGKTFSIPLMISPGAANTVELDLDRENWTFAAVGWDNGTITPFEGTAKCAVTNVSLNSAEQTVVLTLAAANCSDTYFGTNTIGNNFKTMDLITCGTLNVDMSGTPFVHPTNSNSYCIGNGNLSADMKVHAKSAVVSAAYLMPGSNSELSSPLYYCVDLYDGKTAAHPKRFPGKNLPLRIDFFETECGASQPVVMSKFFLGKGPDYTYSTFDHHFYNGTGTTGLILLPTVSKRSNTSLEDSLPQFKCDATNPCIAFPNTTSGRVIRTDDFFYLKPEGGNTCSELIGAGSVTLNATAATFNPANDCMIKDGKIFIKISQAEWTANCSASCTLVTNFSTPFTLGLEKENAGSNVQTLDAYDHIFRSIGHEDMLVLAPSANQISARDSLRLFSGVHGDNDRKDFGILTDERELFLPPIAGLYGTVTSSTIIGKNINMSVWDEGQLLPFNLKVESDSTAVPTYMAVDNNSSAVSSSRTYTHKVTLSRIVGGTYIPMKVMRFDYGYKVGMAESYKYGVDSGNDRARTERSLIYWNTEVAGHERMERYQYDKTTLASNTSSIQNYSTSFIRAEREATIGEGNARIEELRFESRKDGATFKESAHKQLTYLKDTNAAHTQSHTSWSSGTPLSYFTQNEFKEFNRSSAPSMLIAHARSPNNNRSVMAWSEYDGTDYDLKVVIKSAGAAAQRFTFTTNAVYAFTPRVSINNGGEVGLAWSETYSTNLLTYAMVWYGSNWINAYTNTNVSNNTAPSTGSGYLSSNGGSGANAIDIIDENPTSNVSAKTIVYSKNSSGWKLMARGFTGGTWSSELNPSANISNGPYEINLNKVGSDYWITAVYNSSGNKLAVFKMDDFSAVDASNTPLSLTNYQHVKSSHDGTQMKIYVFDGNPANNVHYSTAGASTVAGSYSFANSGFDMFRDQYCFTRSMTSSQGLNETPTTGCTVPETSFAEPIKSSFYHHDIDGLKPTDFINVFSIP